MQTHLIHWMGYRGKIDDNGECRNRAENAPNVWRLAFCTYLVLLFWETLYNHATTFFGVNYLDNHVLRV